MFTGLFYARSKKITQFFISESFLVSLASAIKRNKEINNLLAELCKTKNSKSATIA